MNDKRNEKLQALSRDYLCKLRYLAKKHGMLEQLNGLIRMNRRRECSATEHECEMLARMCDDERVSRIEVPKILGKTYTQCFDENDFDKVKKLRHVGIYSKVSTLLLKSKQKKQKDGN